MTSKEIYENFENKKDKFYNYLNNIKKNIPINIYTIINPTIVNDPHASTFTNSFFLDKYKKANIFNNFLFYYVKFLYSFVSFLIIFLCIKLFLKKDNKNLKSTIFDVYNLIDETNKHNKLNEKYFGDLYDICDENKKEYTIMLRIIGAIKNPLKLIKFLKIINNEQKDVIIDYQLVGFFDIFRIFRICFIYPFTIFRLRQYPKEENILFNNAIINDLKFFHFDSVVRFFVGKNLAKIDIVKDIFSWSEFQVVERSFNYAIRKNNSNIVLNGCQFFLNYEIYFSSFIYDIDYDMYCSPHNVLVNGKAYIKDTKKIRYKDGISLRYKSVFEFNGIKEEKNIILLGSYILQDTKYMIQSLKNFDNIIFKNHPVVDINNFGDLLDNVKISQEDIYKLFENAKVVVSTASGTLIEAVACGISAIVLASQDNLTANPLVEYGREKIWDIAYDASDIEQIYKKLVDYKNNNKEEIKNIAKWYKDNFFIEPSENNIKKVFEL